MSLTMRHVSVGSMDNNAYLLTDDATGQQCLIDAAADAPRLRQLVDEGTGRLDLLVTTHQHHDHVGALRAITQAFPEAVTAAGDKDAGALPVKPTKRLKGGEELQLGESTLRVIELRGHTPGGVAIETTDPGTGRVDIYTGDSLFPGGVGNTKSPGQDFDQLFSDVKTRLFDVYEDAHIWPGHGKPTTLAAERPHLEEWRKRGW